MVVVEIEIVLAKMEISLTWDCKRKRKLKELPSNWHLYTRKIALNIFIYIILFFSCIIFCFSTKLEMSFNSVPWPGRLVLVSATIWSLPYSDMDVWWSQYSPALTSDRMKPRSNGMARDQRSKSFQGEGPNWVLIAGGALLSTLSIRLGYKLKQLNDTKHQESSSKDSKGSLWYIML